MLVLLSLCFVMGVPGCRLQKPLTNTYQQSPTSTHNCKCKMKRRLKITPVGDGGQDQDLSTTASSASVASVAVKSAQRPNSIVNSC